MWLIFTGPSYICGSLTTRGHYNNVAPDVCLGRKVQLRKEQ